MNSIIESLKVERRKIRITIVNNKVYARVSNILVDQDKKFVTPPFQIPFPRDWNFPFDNYLIGIHAPLRTGGIQMHKEKFIVYLSS